MALVFRGDLPEMTRAKSEVQAAHAAFEAAVNLAKDNPDLLAAYMADNQPKIGLEAEGQEHLLKIVEKAKKREVPVTVITDAGRTIFEGPTMTCAIIGPMSKTDSNSITRGTRMRDKEPSQ